MKLRSLAPAFLLIPLAAGLMPGQRILLSQIDSLTLRSDQMTKGRRVAPIPQLKCVGGDGKGKYEVDVMRCRNVGSDYQDEYVSWACTADLPREFKLGSTDVICEGYESPDDRFILKGSCGVEYRLALTDYGYEKYGGYTFSKVSRGINWSSLLFYSFFLTILIWIIYSAYTNRDPTAIPRPRRPRFPPTSRWFGGGGGDDPPPYDPRPPRKAYSTTSSEPWRPGFWSGLAAGAAGTYMMGGRTQPERPAGYPGFGGGAGGGGGFQSWGGTSGGGRGESSSAGAARHTSTGFGQTRRR